MPSRSHKQRRYLFARFGAAWVKRHHYDKVKPKKSRAKPAKRKKSARKRRK